MKRFLVVKTGKTYDGIRARFGCFEDWMAAGLGVARERVQTVSVFEGGLLPKRLDDIAGVVITGSPAMVTDRQPWSEAVARWLVFELAEKHADVPLLGICYGHQLIAHAFGGRVGWNPRGREIGTVEIRATTHAVDDPLFGGLSFPFAAHATHLQSALELPPGAVHLAASDLEPHHAFRLGARVWGVQFHPEFSAGIMQAYIDVLDERMAGEGLDVAAIRAGVGDAGQAAGVLRHFADLATAGLPSRESPGPLRTDT